MRAIITWLLVVSIAVHAIGDDAKPAPPDKKTREQRYIDTAIEQTREAAKREERLAAQLQRQSDSLKKPVRKRGSGDAIKKYNAKRDELSGKIASAKKRHEELASGRKILPPTIDLPLSVGKIGYVGELKILQVVNANEARAQLGKQDVWLRGIDTAKLADDSTVQFKQPLDVTGTRQYTTVIGGTNTVFVLEPFDDAKEMKALAKMQIEAGKTIEK